MTDIKLNEMSNRCHCEPKKKVQHKHIDAIEKQKRVEEMEWGCGEKAE